MYIENSQFTNTFIKLINYILIMCNNVTYKLYNFNNIILS